MYLVSILVPIYGVEKYIERCARSLFEQTYDNLEYIFVDDCSPDNSIAILENVMEDYPERKAQVRIIRHELNRGLAAARNTALDAAQGSFLTHVDSDDYLDRDAVRLLVNKQVETGADIVTGNYYIVGANGIKEVFEPEYKDQHEMLLQEISAHSNTHYIWRRLINSNLYRKYQIRPKEGVNFMEDWQQIALLVYYAEKVARIDEPIYYYDCTNSNSYISNYPFKAALWEQSTEAACFVEKFFADKEPEYRDLAHRSAILKIKHHMSLAAKYRKKTVFQNIKNKIMSEYADCYDEIGWNNPIVRAFMCNYTLNGMYRQLLNVIGIRSHR